MEKLEYDLKREGRCEMLPASSSQQRLWTIQQLDPGNIAYNVPFIATFRGDLNIFVLEKSLTSIIKRHCVLRTSFRLADGDLVQVIEDDKIVHLNTESVADNEELQKRIAQEIREPFLMDRCPLFRLRLFVQSPDAQHLVLTFHHSIFDGWSALVFFEELSKTYMSLALETPLELTGMEQKYKNYFLQEKHKVSNESLQDQVDYWKQQLSGELPSLLLPTDRHRSAVPTGQHSGVYTYDMSKESSRSVKEFAKQQKTSLFVTLLTCFKTLIYRYTQQNDILVGIPFANRNQETVSDLIGFLVNTLVIRTSVPETSGFRSYLSHVHEAAVDAYSHSELPYDRVVQSVRFEQEDASAPLIRLMFNQREFNELQYDLPQVSLKVTELWSASPQFELVFHVCDLGDTIRIVAEYDSGLFRETSIERFVRQFAVLAKHAVADPDIPIASLQLAETQLETRETAHSQRMIRFPDTSVGLHKLFEAQVERTPQSIAVECDGVELTYRELNLMANRLAKHLLDQGIQRNTLVALGTQRSPALAVGVLGILKAGAAYVPMDPGYPADRLRYLIEDSCAPFLVVEEELLSNFPRCQAVPVLINSFMSADEDDPGNPQLESTSEDSAYVIYTSGTTGRPKGCLIQHRNVTRLFESAQSWLNFSSADVCTLFHSYSFDFSVWEFWGALLYGGRLVIVSADIARSPMQFLSLLIQKQVTVLNQTPSAFWPLMESALSSESMHGLCLRVIVFGGEQLDFERLAPWYEQFEENTPEIFNMYGITETTVHNTIRRIKQSDTVPGSISRIGEPLPDLKLYVLDQHLNPVPQGIPGELYVSGPGVASGYLNKPDLTAERFLLNPFDQGQYGRLYRTGDQVRQISDTDYEYWGRLDAQVKIRGYRIELSEIEAAIRGLAGVKAAVVTTYAEQHKPAQLIAYVVTDHADVSIKEMHSELRQMLPSFMTPSVIMEVPSIPVTSNGKVDRSRLPAPRLELDTEAAYISASSPLEQQLAEIWSQVLGVKTVGIEHNFFQIGGDSIRCIQVVSLAQMKGIELKVEQIFRFPTIKALASVLLPKQQSSSDQTYETFSLIADDQRALLQPEAIDAYPLISLQQGMLFHSEYSPADAVYYVMNSIRVNAYYDRQALEKAYNLLIRQHDILRTTFSMDGFKEPLQIITPYKPVPLYETDLRELEQSAHEAYLRTWWDEESKKIDLYQGPAFTLTSQLLSDDYFQLCLCTHHALIDGWSVASFFTELLLVYVSLLDNAGATTSEPLPLSTRFAEYVGVEQAILQSQECREFWQDWLKGCSISKIPRLALKSVETPGYSGNFVQEFPKSLLNGLEHFSTSFDVPLRSVLLAAHLKIMSLLIGEQDLTTGVVYNCRPDTVDSDKVLGLFLNTLPFRYELDNSSWIDFVQNLWAQENRLLPYRNYPLSKIKQDHGGSPLFEIMFNYTHFHIYSQLDQEIGISLMESVDFSAPIYPLVVDFLRDVDSNTLRLSLVWDTREFEQIQMESVMKLYIRTLTELVRSPHLSSLAPPKLTAEERQIILYEWNRHQDLPGDFTPVYRLFELQAAATPGMTAIVDRRIRKSYEELNTASNQIAHSLCRLGAGNQSLVGIRLYKSWEAVAAIIGVLKAGSAYVPLDPDYPQERLDHMIAESGIRILITDDAANLQANSSTQILLLEEALSCEEQSNPCLQTTEDQLAYVIFTSGSTGKPKGAMNTQGGLSQAYDAWNKAYDLRSITCNLQMTSFAFDVFTADVFRTLCSGGKLLLCPQEVLMNASEMYALMIQEQVDFGFFLPAVMRNLVRYLQYTDLKLDSVKVMIVGADYWFVNEYKQLQQVCGEHARIINSYGVAEATVDSIYFEGDGNRIPEHGNIPIGRPFANMSSYILSPDMEPLYPGMTGELYIGGSCVGMGYINRADLTKEKFLDSPFVPGERLYKTGDLGRYWPDGNIEFIGRRDHQLKVRGYRVDLGEIESVLRSVSEIKDAVVIPAESEPSLVQLQAYLVFDEKGSQDIHKVKLELKNKLPEYMMPSAYFQLDEMPINPNGKIDRNRITECEAIPIKTDVPYIPARNKTELMLSSIFTAILGIERISVLDNVFDIGADSLKALKIIARIRAGLGVELSLKSIFTNPTIAGIAREISAQAPESSMSTIEHTGIELYAPLSYAQQRLWFFESLQPGTATYNVPVVLKFNGLFDCVILEKALRDLTVRHEALRTVFRIDNGQPVQTVLETDFQLSRIELTPNETWQQRMSESVRRPFDMNQDSLFRAELISITSEVNVLVITMHHLITDGWSVSILIEELAHIYNAEAGNSKLCLPELKIRYTDFTQWQRKMIEHGGIQEQLQYWLEKLEDAPHTLQLPLDFARPAEKSYRGAVETLELAVTLTHPLQAIAQEQETTLFNILLSAYIVLLARYTGQDDIVIGTPVTNRSHEELEPLLGMFVNTLVLRSQISGEMSFMELVSQVKTSLLEAISYSDLPFEHLVSVLNPERRLSMTPLFQVMFLMEQPGKLPEFNGLQVEQLPPSGESSKCDITLSVSYHPERLHVSITYDPDLFLPSTVKNMLENYRMVLESITTSPGATLHSLPFAAPSQMLEIIRMGTGEHRSYDTRLRLHDLFIRQARLTPDSISCVSENTCMTYKELHMKSDQLARFLVRMGVGSDTFAGLYMDSSVEMIIGLLGILKAGAAFVPLDPSFPDERVDYILDNSEVSLIVSHSHLSDKLNCYCPIINMDDDWNLIGSEATEIDLPDISPESAAYVLYTTGSTGQPKGVIVEHRQIVNYVLGVSEKLDLSECSSFAMVQPLTVDSCQTVLFPAFCAGGTLHLITRELSLDAPGLAEYFGCNAIDCLKIAPTHIRALQKHSGIQAFMPRKRLILGGEPSDPEWIQELLKYSGECHVYNHYGPTETTVGVATFRIQLEEHAPDTGIPIGTPLPNIRFFIVDINGRPVPQGVAGELWVGGSAVTRGYLKQDDLTREKYISASFEGLSGERVYRTGDRVRMLWNGAIEFLGRVDDQIKVNGYRVEPAELARVLAKHPDVKEIAVLPKFIKNGSKCLIAYLVPAAEAEKPSYEEMNAYVLRALPSHFLPYEYIWMDELPLTMQGKINRSALPDPETQIIPSQGQPPRDKVEEQLADIWSHILGEAEVGIHDNFFRLGGDSILSMQFISQVRSIGWYLTLKHLFQFQTIAELAEYIRQTKLEVQDPGTHTGHGPISPMQAWFFEHHSFHSTHWNQSLLLETDSSLSYDLLNQAASELIRQHPVLRTRFIRNEHQQWIQETLSDLPHHTILYVNQVDMSPDAADKALAHHAKQLQQAVSVAENRLCRMAYYNRGEGSKSLLLVILHHLIVDGVSWRIITDDLQSICRQLLIGQNPRLPAPTVPFHVWASSIQEQALKLDPLQELERWRWLQNSATTLLPIDSTQDNTERQSETVTIELDAITTDRLIKEGPSKWGVHVNAVLLAVLIESYKQFSGYDNLSVDLESHGRGHSNLELYRTIGWFTVHLPIPLHSSPGGFMETIHNIDTKFKRSEEAGWKLQWLKYAHPDAKIRREAQKIPQPSIKFNYLGQFNTLNRDSLLTICDRYQAEDRSPDSIRSHSICMDMLIINNKLRMQWTYSKAQCKQEDILILADTYSRLAAEITVAPHVTTTANKTELWMDGSHPSLIPFGNMSGINPYFFCVHPITGSVHSYLKLSQTMQPHFRFIGIQAPSLGDSGLQFNEITDLASYYIQAIQSVQPHGPYYLGGWSMGGMIAFEIARLLRINGEEIQGLVIMDKDVFRPRFASEAEYLLAYLFDAESPLAPSEFLEMDAAEQMNWLVAHSKIRQRYGNQDSNSIRQKIDLLRNHIHMLWNYTPQPYNGSLLVVSAEDTVQRMKQDPSLGWKSVTTELQVITVPGDHYSFIQEELVENIVEGILKYFP